MFLSSPVPPPDSDSDAYDTIDGLNADSDIPGDGDFTETADQVEEDTAEDVVQEDGYSDPTADWDDTMEADGVDVPVEVDVPLDLDGWDEGPEITDGTEDVPVDPDASDAVELPPGLVWVEIPAGAFEMGCSSGDVECDANEEPRHTVNVSGFEMTETEITQEQYEWVTGSNPSFFSSCPDCPVETVTWHEAKAFCEVIGGRLPSEAQWEYAARAGTTTRYYCGDDEACLDGIAWYSATTGFETHPVGEKTANAFGLYDMLGNVWEWVEDCWHADYIGAPSTGGVWSGGDCLYSVWRGGSWDDNAGSLRVSGRYGAGLDSYGRDFGFRCSQ